MKTTYSLFTLLSVSLVAAGPVPIRRNGALMARTEPQAPPAAPVIASAPAAPAAAPAAPMADTEAQKAAEEKFGMNIANALQEPAC
jgi:hypothetical protein